MYGPHHKRQVTTIKRQHSPLSLRRIGLARNMGQGQTGTDAGQCQGRHDQVRSPKTGHTRTRIGIGPRDIEMRIVQGTRQEFGQGQSSNRQSETTV